MICNAFVDISYARAGSHRGWFSRSYAREKRSEKGLFSPPPDSEELPPSVRQ
jgi:hypothetical protein